MIFVQAHTLCYLGVRWLSNWASWLYAFQVSWSLFESQFQTLFLNSGLCQWHSLNYKAVSKSLNRTLWLLSYRFLVSIPLSMPPNYISKHFPDLFCILMLWFTLSLLLRLALALLCDTWVVFNIQEKNYFVKFLLISKKLSLYSLLSSCLQLYDFSKPQFLQM